jgi:peptide/nickel transport system permease protein
MNFRFRHIPFFTFTCMVILIGVMVIVFSAEFIVPHNPVKQNLADRLKPPSFYTSGSKQYWLGTDHLGRDLLSRIVYGSRISLAVGISSVLIGGFIGTLLGMISGFWGGKLDEVIMAIVDIQLAFPLILLSIAVIAVLGPSFINLIIVIGISGWVTYARIARGQVLGLKKKEFIEAVRAVGGSKYRIIFLHILPNILSPLIVVGTLDMARTIILESTLSFLGLGIRPPTPSWGVMLSEGREYLTDAWWIATFPGIALMFTTLSFNMIGDWLRDITDPRRSGY